MTTIDAELAAHLAGEMTTLCHCWRVLLADGAVLGFTDHDRSLAFGGDDFEPETGLGSSEARQSLGLAADAMDVAGALASERISAADIEAGRYDGASVETWLVDWRAPESRRTIIARAIIGNIDRRDGAFTAELHSPIKALDRRSGRHYRRACDAELGDTSCGLDLAQPGYRASATIIALEATNRIRVTGLAGFAEDWFSLGWLLPAAGARPLRLQRHLVEGTEALLLTEGPATLAPGAAVELVAGCDKRFTTCKAKFGNGVNFRGFPHLPGNDAAYAYVRDDLTFDGGPLVP